MVVDVFAVIVNEYVPSRVVSSTTFLQSADVKGEIHPGWVIPGIRLVT